MSSSEQAAPAAILIVEDEPLIRMDATDMVSELGYRVLEASNSNDAITILKAHPEIRLVFTDIEMPGAMDGLKLGEYVSDRWPPIKLIIVSGQVCPDTDALPPGVVFVSKPYQTGQIRRAISTLLAA